MRLGRRSTCDEGPFRFKLCDNDECVPYSQPCPCDVNEFRCIDNTCIPRSYLCNGRADCPGSSDEINCTIKHPGGMPFHVIMGIIGGGVVLLTLVSLMVIIVGKQKLKNRRNNSNSGKEPLRSDCDQTTESQQKTPPIDSRPLMQKQQSLPVHSFTPKRNGAIPVHSFTPKRNSRIQVYNNMLSSVDIDFGEGLLCTSTPKQAIRQHSKPCIFTESPIKDASASDLSKNLNMSLFIPIT